VPHALGLVVRGAHRSSLRQDELRTLAEIGALASFGGQDRRTALWQAERAARPVGELLMDEEDASKILPEPGALGLGPDRPSPLPPMSLAERVRADYDGTGLTIG
jgi:DNA polymerase III alpha subunit